MSLKVVEGGLYERNINEAREVWMRLELTDIKIYWDVQSSSLAIELYNCLDQEINDSDWGSQRRLVVAADWSSSQHFLGRQRKKDKYTKPVEREIIDRKPFNGMFWLFLFWLEWSEVRERQRGLINNLYDDMESHNSKAVSEIYLSTGYFQSLLPMGNGTWQKDAWTKRTKNYWLEEYKSIQEYLSLLTSEQHCVK